MGCTECITPWKEWISKGDKSVCPSKGHHKLVDFSVEKAGSLMCDICDKSMNAGQAMKVCKVCRDSNTGRQWDICPDCEAKGVPKLPVCKEISEPGASKESEASEESGKSYLGVLITLGLLAAIALIIFFCLRKSKKADDVSESQVDPLAESNGEAFEKADPEDLV